MTQRLPAILTSLESALRLLLDGLKPVAPIDVPVGNSVGCVAAAMTARQAIPESNMAAADGWALHALDTVGASSYAPLSLAAQPMWVEAGDRLPEPCDCVLDPDLVEQAGRVCQVLAEALPGQGIRRAGEDMAAGRSILATGRRVDAFDTLVARAAGLDRISVRSPRVAVIDVPSADGKTASSEFVLAFVKALGARATRLQAKGRDAASLSAALEGNACDLIVIVGGSGIGRHDATIAALKSCGADSIHGLALQPGRTAAVGRLGATPVVVAPGAPDQTLAACLALIQPALDVLMARAPRAEIMRPLARKIASSVNIAELALLETVDEAWMPIAVEQFSLDAIARAEAWLVVPADSEGYAAGTAVGACLLRDTM